MSSRSLNYDQTALDPLLLELGSTLMVCQGFEQALVFLLAVVDMEEQQQLTEGSLLSAADALSEVTLGRLLQKLRNKLELPVGVDAQFTAAWKERNWIVHRFLQGSANTLGQPGGLSTVVADLRSRKATIREANHQAELIADEYLAQFRMDLEQLQNNAELRLAQLYPRPTPAASSQNAA